MINIGHFCLLCSFVVLVISLFICCRAGEVESLDLGSSPALILYNIYGRTSSVLSRYRPEGMWCDAALRMMACKIFSPFWQLVEAIFIPSYLLYLYCCCCCSPSETYGRKWGDSNFQILAELTVPPQAAGVVGTFQCALYISF